MNLNKISKDLIDDKLPVVRIPKKAASHEINQYRQISNISGTLVVN